MMIPAHLASARWLICLQAWDDRHRLAVTGLWKDVSGYRVGSHANCTWTSKVQANAQLPQKQSTEDNIVIIDVSDVEVLFDTLVAKSYGALGTIVYGGLAAHTCELETYWLLQFNGDYTRCTDKVGGDHYSLAATV